MERPWCIIFKTEGERVYGAEAISEDQMIENVSKAMRVIGLESREEL